MENEVCKGKSDQLVSVGKQFIVCMIFLLAVSYIVGDALRIYTNRCIYKEDKKVIYEIEKYIDEEEIEYIVSKAQT